MTGSSSLNILIIHIFVFRRLKSISSRNLLEKMNEIWKNNYLGVNFVFFKSPFWPEVDNVDSWIFISYLVLRSFSHASNLEKIELNLWSRHRFFFFNQNCGCDGINYANKPKHNHAQLDSLGMIFRKFHWNQAVSLWELLIRDRHT